jgi:hypothetical protein
MPMVFRANSGSLSLRLNIHLIKLDLKYDLFIIEGPSLVVYLEIYL